MRRIVPLVALLAPAAAPAQAIEILPGVELPASAEVETQVNGDFNGDEVEDAAYIAHDEDSRTLTVVLSVRDEFTFEYRTEVLPLDPASLGAGALSLDGNVLRFEDLTGGTTAISSIRRFRYDGRGERMRLIGLDATLYSRTYAHDGFELSWNLLTGDVTTRELRLDQGSGDAAYEPGPQRGFERRISALWLSDSPDPETVLEEIQRD